MRGYYNDINKLDKRECQELIKYSNSEKEIQLARQRILELEKIAIRDTKKAIREARKKEEKNKETQNCTSQSNLNKEHKAYSNDKSNMSTNSMSTPIRDEESIWTTIWNVIKCIGMFVIALNMLIQCLN